MHFIKIDYLKALSLQEEGKITLIDVSRGQLPPLKEEYGQLWKDNFERLLTKVPHISPDKILDFFSAKYMTEFTECTSDNGITWRFLYGIENKQIQDKTKDNIEYVYILVNAGYPNLVKIGMTITDVHRRVTGINNAGTVHEWVPRFAIPVEKGSAIKVERQVHKALASLRVSSDLGNSREFFNIDPLSALDKLREIGSLSMVGDPIIF
jgi:hypothetical protein